MEASSPVGIPTFKIFLIMERTMRKLNRPEREIGLPALRLSIRVVMSAAIVLHVSVDRAAPTTPNFST